MRHEQCGMSRSRRNVRSSRISGNDSSCYCSSSYSSCSSFYSSFSCCCGASGSFLTLFASHLQGDKCVAFFARAR